MQKQNTDIPDVCILIPKVFSDSRGFFFESFNKRVFDSLGLHGDFVQDNRSFSVKGVLRGLHYQVEEPQGKLVSVTHGEIYDVAVDLRRGSAFFGKWTAAVLSSDNHHMLWLPPGFAHGFLVLSETAKVLYKATAYYAPQFEQTIIWNDPDLNIVWPFLSPLLSTKDANGKRFSDVLR